MKSRLYGALHPTRLRHLSSDSNSPAIVHLFDISRWSSATMRASGRFGGNCVTYGRHDSYQVFTRGIFVVRVPPALSQIRLRCRIWMTSTQTLLLSHSL